MEACWAHNPEVRGSKPRSANRSFFEILTKRFFYWLIVICKLALLAGGPGSNSMGANFVEKLLFIFKKPRTKDLGINAP